MVGIAVLAFAYILSQFFRSFLAVLAPQLIADLGVSEAELSTAAGMWFIAFALMQFPVGYGLDRFGPKRTAGTILLSAVAGTFLFAAATGAAAIILAMALIGVGCSALLMASIFIFARNYSPRRFAMFASWFVAFGLAGGVMGSAPLAIAAESFGWRQVLVALGFITLTAAGAIFALVPDPPTSAGEAEGQAKGSLMQLLRMRQLWPLMAMASVAYAPAANIRGLWAGPFLADVYGMPTEAIGNAVFFMSIALIAGSVAYGPLDVAFNTRKWVPFTGSTLTALLIAGLAVIGGGSQVGAVVLLTAVAFVGSNYSMIMAHARSFMPPHLIGRGVTLMNFFSMGGAGFVQFLSGGVYDIASTASPGEGAYQVLFGFYAFLLAAGLAVYVFSRDRRPTEAMAAVAESAPSA